MANDEQVERLKQGVGEWNKWRIKNPIIAIELRNANFGYPEASSDKGSSLRVAYLTHPHFGGSDLSEADLRGADLRNANLSETDLRNANLTEANLSGANLARAHLSGAHLLNAILDGANLVEANLKGANLGCASLKKVILYNTIIYGATLNGADLSESVIGFTIFIGVDMSKIKGLEEAQHEGPSKISIDTLRVSKGKIPEKFLRGCGLNDWEIESAKLYEPGLSIGQVTDITSKILQLIAGDPIQYYSVFISYSSMDEAFASQLHDDLQNRGVRCWFAPKDVQGGRKLHEQIDNAIQRNDRTLLIVSDNSMNSEWVKTEIAKTRKRETKEKRRILFPIRLVDFAKVQAWEFFDADMGKDSAREIREYFIPDFSNWQDEQSYKSAFERLIKDLRATEGEQDGK